MNIGEKYKKMSKARKYFNMSEICRGLNKDRTSITTDYIPKKFIPRFKLLFEWMDEWMEETKKFD